MDLGARIGWGIVIYAVTYLAAGGTGIYGWPQGIEGYLSSLLVLILVALWGGFQLKFRGWKDILPYSIGWALIAVAFDALYVVPFQGWGWYGEWMPWIKYALIVLAPLLSVYLKKRAPAPGGAWES
jgi:hypothetical protein